MALTIRDITEADIASFQELTGKKTASGALMQAAQIGVSASQELAEARQVIKDLRTCLATYRQTLQQLTPLCLKVVDLAAQKDLFTNDK